MANYYECYEQSVLTTYGGAVIGLELIDSGLLLAANLA